MQETQCYLENSDTQTIIKVYSCYFGIMGNAKSIYWIARKKMATNYYKFGSFKQHIFSSSSEV